MKKFIFGLILSLICFTGCQEKTSKRDRDIVRDLAVVDTRIKVAIIDTGITINDETKKYLCLTGHQDFTGNGLEDTHSHGTNIAGIIAKNLDTTKYCLLIYKYYRNGSGYDNLSNEIKSFIAAGENGAQYINLSGGGDEYSDKEDNVIQSLLKKGIKIIVAAGNNGWDLSKNCTYWPACIKDTTGNLYPVGNCVNNVYQLTSNYGGPVKQCENGKRVEGFGIKMSGTSQSAAIFMNRLLVK